MLFDGKNEDEWAIRDKSPARVVADGALTVNKQAGGIETKRRFQNYQLHISGGFRSTSRGPIKRAATAASSRLGGQRRCRV